jgi:hypothetical protein
MIYLFAIERHKLMLRYATMVRCASIVNSAEPTTSM